MAQQNWVGASDCFKMLQLLHLDHPYQSYRTTGFWCPPTIWLGPAGAQRGILEGRGPGHKREQYKFYLKRDIAWNYILEI